MPIILAPFEVLLVLALIYILFFVYRKLLNSSKLTEVIEEVTDPVAQTDEQIGQQFEDAKQGVKNLIDENESEAERRVQRNKALRAMYGGPSE
jgi:hypothetical protein